MSGKSGSNLTPAPLGNAPAAPLRDRCLRNAERLRYGGDRASCRAEGLGDIHGCTLSGLMMERKPLRMTPAITPRTNPAAGGIQEMHAKVAKLRPLTKSEHALLDRLGAALASAGMSWGAAAKICGKSENLGNQWSSRRSCPVQRDVETIASHLGVRMSWLLSGDEPTEQTQARTARELELLQTLREMPEDQQRAAIGAVKAIRDSFTKK